MRVPLKNLILLIGIILNILANTSVSFGIETNNKNIIEGQGFRLLSEDGEIAAELKLTRSGPVLIIYSENSTQTIPLSTLAGDQNYNVKEQAKSLLAQKKYTEVIDLLKNQATENPNDFIINSLLLRAEIEQCAINIQKSDRSAYQIQLQSIYARTQRLYRINPTHPEPLYILAKSLYLNKKPSKAYDILIRTYETDQNNQSYFILLGDICLEKAYTSTEYDIELGNSDNLYAKKAIKAYKKALTFADNNHDSTAMIEKKIKKARRLKN